MNINRPELTVLGMADLQMRATHPNHIRSGVEDFLNAGNRINEIGDTIGAEAAVRSGGFSNAMLAALDRVSADQQFASAMNEAAFLDPDLVDPHDITIAQAQANMSLNITRTVLNRLVQSWRDLINTR